jgi:hypothetical protein
MEPVRASCLYLGEKPLYEGDALRHMAKADPVMCRVWLRHIKQQGFYPAKASRWRLVGAYSC